MSHGRSNRYRQRGESPASILHFSPGYSSVVAADLEGDVFVVHDAPAVGPAPTRSSPATYDRVRRRFWGATEVGTDRIDKAPSLALRDEVVIWTAPSPWHQMNLVRLLALLPRLTDARISIVHVERARNGRQCAGVDVDPAELPARFTRRKRATSHEVHLARRTWAALGADQPQAAARIARSAEPVLPRLSTALVRILQELPSTRTGLARSERNLLMDLRRGPTTVSHLIVGVRRRERASHGLWMGDLVLTRSVDALIHAPTPLIDVVERAPRGLTPYARTVALTHFGRRVLDGRADHASANGVDRWVGGTHVTGASPMWRWDDDKDDVVKNA
jgi:hypothetical protein